MYEATSDSTPLMRAPERRAARVRALASVSVLSWTLVAVGGVLRVVRFADNRSLWLDEAMLSLNLLDRGFVALLKPLDYEQAAPPLFLLLQKLSVVMLGETEYALRLVPLLAGIAALILFRRLALRVLPGFAGLVALSLFAVAEPLVSYSAEVKQYSLDVLAAVALLSLAAEPLLSGKLSARRAAALGGAGALAVLVSYPSVFVLAGIAGALVLVPLMSSRRPTIASLLLSGAWLVVFGAVFLLIVGTTTDVRAGLALGEEGSGDPLRIARDGWRAFAYPGPFARTTIGLAVGIGALGALFLTRRSIAFLVAVGLTLVATAAAAQLNLYPLYGRFILFLVPLVLLLVGAGVQALREATAGRGRAVWVTVLVVLVGYPVASAADNLVSPPQLEETRGVLRSVDESWRPGDALVVTRLAQPAAAYYAECEACGAMQSESNDGLRRLVLSARTRDTKKGLRSTGRLSVVKLDSIPYAAYASELAHLSGERRVWVLFSSGWDRTFVDYALGCLGRRLETFESTNAAAYLYDFTRPQESSGGCLAR